MKISNNPGRSFMDFLGNDNENKDPKSRRVEFKFI